MNISFLTPNFNQNRQQPAFQGYSRRLQNQLDNILIKKTLTSQDKLDLIEAIKKVIPTTLVSEKFIEKGSHASVYQITRKYAARVPNEVKINPDNVGNNLKIGENIFRNLNNYFGEAVVELGQFQILRNVGRHTTAGVPQHKAEKLSLSEIKKYYLEKYLPKFANLPQGSYDEIAADLNKVNSMKSDARTYYCIDAYNPNNIVAKSDRLFIVDEFDRLCDISYNNTTAKLLDIFINRATKDVEAPFAGDKVNLVRKIFKKIIISSEKHDLVQANSKEDYESWNKALKKCCINIEAYKVLNNLEGLFVQYKNIDERVQQVKNYLAQIFIANKI